MTVHKYYVAVLHASSSEIVLNQSNTKLCHLIHLCIVFSLIVFTGEAVTEEVELQLSENVIMWSVYASVSVLGNHNGIPSNLSWSVQPLDTMRCNL